MPSLLLGLCLAAHPNSFSRTDVALGGGELEVRQELQCLSLLEVLPALDGDADGFLSAREVRGGAADIAAYASAHYRLSDAGRGAPLRPTVGTVAVELQAPARDAWFPTEEWVALVWTVRAPGVRRIAIELDLFGATSPGHLDHVRVTWRGRRPVHDVLVADGARWECAPGPSLVREATARSARAWLGAPLAFVLALALGCARRRTLLRAAAVWLVASSAAIVARAHEFVKLDERFVDLTAALSVAYLAADVLLHPRAHTRWVEALLFGVLHGVALGALFAEHRVDGAGPAPVLAFVAGSALGGVATLAGGAALGARLRAGSEEAAARRMRFAAGVVLAGGLLLFARRAVG
jgi:hypothetical protein